jgi:hypothetical protein
MCCRALPLTHLQRSRKVLCCVLWNLLPHWQSALICLPAGNTPCYAHPDKITGMATCVVCINATLKSHDGSTGVHRGHRCGPLPGMLRAARSAWMQHRCTSRQVHPTVPTTRCCLACRASPGGVAKHASAVLQPICRTLASLSLGWHPHLWCCWVSDGGVLAAGGWATGTLRGLPAFLGPVAGCARAGCLGGLPLLRGPEAGGAGVGCCWDDADRGHLRGLPLFFGSAGGDSGGGCGEAVGTGRGPGFLRGLPLFFGAVGGAGAPSSSSSLLSMSELELVDARMGLLLLRAPALVVEGAAPLLSCCWLPLCFLAGGRQLWLPEGLEAGCAVAPVLPWAAAPCTAAAHAS